MGPREKTEDERNACGGREMVEFKGDLERKNIDERVGGTRTRRRRGIEMPGREKGKFPARKLSIESDCLWVVTSASSFPPYFGINTGRISSSRQLVKIISIPLSLGKLVKVPTFFHTVFSLLLLLLLLYKEIMGKIVS